MQTPHDAYQSAYVAAIAAGCHPGHAADIALDACDHAKRDALTFAGELVAR